MGSESRVLYSPPVETRSMECVGCAVDDRENHLNKCPICFKWVCDNCGHLAFGRVFCARKCADAFFFGDDDE
jgi:hypothetical protein